MKRYTITVLAYVAIAWTAPAIARVDERDSRWAAPPRAAALANPLANRPDAEAGGRKLFQQRCATCHGPDGRGTAKAPDLTAGAVPAQTDGALFWKISGGNAHGGMPAFSFLPPLQRWQLVLHLRALQRSANDRPITTRDSLSPFSLKNTRR